jgi:hypothetical protein
MKAIREPSGAHWPSHPPFGGGACAAAPLDAQCAATAATIISAARIRPEQRHDPAFRSTITSISSARSGEVEQTPSPGAASEQRLLTT